MTDDWWIESYIYEIFYDSPFISLYFDVNLNGIGMTKSKAASRFIQIHLLYRDSFCGCSYYCSRKEKGTEKRHLNFKYHSLLSTHACPAAIFKILCNTKENASA